MAPGSGPTESTSEELAKLAAALKLINDRAITHPQETQRLARNVFSPNITITIKPKPTDRPETPPETKKARDAVGCIENIFKRISTSSFHAVLDKARRGNVCIPDAGDTSWNVAREKYERSRVDAETISAPITGEQITRELEEKRQTKSLPTAGEQQMSKAALMCLHEDMKSVEPLQLVYMFRHGDLFDGKDEEWIKISQSINTGSNAREIKDKMRITQKSTQEAIVKRTADSVVHILRKTGGEKAWQGMTAEERTAAFRHIFDTNPVYIADYIFADMAKTIAFDKIFSVDDPVRTVPYQLFTREKFAVLCSAVYTFMIDWEGEFTISGTLPVYEVLRDTSEIRIPGLGGYLDIPVILGRGGGRRAV